MHFLLLFPFILLLSFQNFPGVFPARTIPAVTVDATSAWRNFANFVNLEKGSRATGVCDLKQYFHRFGYLSSPATPLTPANFSDEFDSELETAILTYQKNLGLPITGKLDVDTVDLIMAPRCGLGDNHSHATTLTNTGLHETRHYAYFAGRPRWSEAKPINLTYAFDKDHIINYINYDTIRAVFKRAFARWSDVIPVNFMEVENYRKAEIKIAFFKGDHGDGEPFDGVLGVLAHAFSPENGRLHLDAAETWAVDFDTQESSVAVDLESVVTHEIGHVLGLAHSSVKDAIMYPSLRPRSKKVDLRIDDVEGVQALYGSNPNFNYGSLLESEETSDGGVGGGRRGFSAFGLSIWSLWIVTSLIQLVV
ncbi:metalloendoproteinase 1-MMP-like [Silene latifolia]|uniref:metalloendoproteinase 1-MMP-like n=1 Tax=Silene latifolia TaxID=37657 RepID=UPI003D77371B